MGGETCGSRASQTVRDVIKDTVDLFGVNFQVTMESVFTTLEQTSRMIETTGENMRHFGHTALANGIHDTDTG